MFKCLCNVKTESLLMRLNSVDTITRSTFGGFSDSLSHAILIHVHAYVSLFPGIETNILHQGLKHFLKQLFEKIESLFEYKTNVILKLLYGL